MTDIVAILYRLYQRVETSSHPISSADRIDVQRSLSEVYRSLAQTNEMHHIMGSKDKQSLMCLLQLLHMGLLTTVRMDDWRMYELQQHTHPFPAMRREMTNIPLNRNGLSILLTKYTPSHKSTFVKPRDHLGIGGRRSMRAAGVRPYDKSHDNILMFWNALGKVQNRGTSTDSNRAAHGGAVLSPEFEPLITRCVGELSKRDSHLCKTAVKASGSFYKQLTGRPLEGQFTGADTRPRMNVPTRMILWGGHISIALLTFLGISKRWNDASMDESMLHVSPITQSFPTSGDIITQIYATRLSQANADVERLLCMCPEVRLTYHNA
eukprot:GHVO01005174.1.p1 GENE.GHVO01005174.1~~GHVO01005174.1.p1  ORF type:complete len:360 (+),score=39.53 GHVO01005174.1:112-1080(+)